MKQQSTMVAKGSLMALTLVFASGCSWFKKQGTSDETKAAASENDVVLCSIDGQPVIKESDFLNNLNQMIQANPYFKGATIDTLPKELLRKFMDQLSTQALIEKYSIQHNIEKDPEFIKAYNETEKLIKRSLMVQIFEKHIYDDIKISDADVQKHYDENKERFVKVAGGVLAMGVKFDKEEEADAFYNKVRGHADHFEDIAKEFKHAKVKDFGRISKEAKGMQFEMVPAPIKDAALGMTKAGVEKVKVGKEYWVVRAWDKKGTEIFDLAEVKPHIEAMLKNNLFREALDKSVQGIKNEHTLVVNEDYKLFKEAAAPEAEANNGAVMPATVDAAAAA